MKTRFTAILRREEDLYVALAPELDIAGQGAAPEEALANLRDALELFLETASPDEVQGRLGPEAWITQLEVEHAET